MEKRLHNFTEIFKNSNLNGQSFYLDNSHFDQEEKNEIIQIIINNNGVNINFIYYIFLNLILFIYIEIFFFDK